MDHKSPIHLVSESRGGSMSMTTDGQRRRTQIFVSNIGSLTTRAMEAAVSIVDNQEEGSLGRSYFL